MYSTYNELKSILADKFIKIFKNNIYKLKTTVSKNVYFEVLDDIVNKYNNTFDRSIEMKPIYVKSNSYAKYNDLKGEEIVGFFCEKELQKNNQKEFRIEKIIKRKGNKLYV